MSHLVRSLQLFVVAAACSLAMFVGVGCHSPAPVVAPEKQAIVINVDDTEAIVPVSELDSALHKKVQVIDLKSRRKSWLSPDEFKLEAARQRYVLVQPPAIDSQ